MTAGPQGFWRFEEPTATENFSILAIKAPDPWSFEKYFPIWFKQSNNLSLPSFQRWKITVNNIFYRIELFFLRNVFPYLEVLFPKIGNIFYL